jgi:hypothetical protein
MTSSAINPRTNLRIHLRSVFQYKGFIFLKVGIKNLLRDLPADLYEFQIDYLPNFFL